MVASELKLASELAATSLRLALTPQLAFAGQVMWALVRSGVMSQHEAAELITKLADTITSPLDDPTNDLQAILINPVREHAEALRRVAEDLRAITAAPVAGPSGTPK